jgi:hypothetical protein
MTDQQHAMMCYASRLAKDEEIDSPNINHHRGIEWTRRVLGLKPTPVLMRTPQLR